MKIEVHLLSYDDECMLEFALRHYATFATKVVVHDGGPTPLKESPTFATAMSYAMEGWEVRSWDTKGQLNDEMAMVLKNGCWKGTDADWAICVDADELVYFPKGAEETLSVYENRGAAIIKPSGFDMYHATWPETPGQIYDEVKLGAPSDEWYSKPVLFSPKRVSDSGFGIGAHEARTVLKDGRALNVGKGWPKADPATYLLHFHHGIGTPERVAARLDAKIGRLSAINRRNGWGNFKPGAEHVKEKLALIVPNLVQVIYG